MSTQFTSRILVVDDSKVNRLLLVGHLTKRGYEVEEAEGGERALDSLGLGEGAVKNSAPPFEAVVLDIMMPEIDGLQVLREIRAVWSANDLPVIMATAIDQSEDVVGALELGANDYVAKPIDMPVLLARLRTQVDLRRTHRDLKKAQRSLVDAAKVEAVGYLAAGLAHELRNPLAHLQMGLDLFTGSGAVTSDPSLVTASELMRDAIERADEIVRSVMNVTQSGDFVLVGGSINTLLAGLLEERADTLKTSGITCRLALDPSDPEVPFAEVELREAIRNVIDNAVEAMPEGGELQLSTQLSEATPSQIIRDEGSRSGLALREGDEVVVIEVLDTGTGIPEQALRKIFDPFFSKKPTGRASGTGLGLSVAQKVIELHSGTLSVENREDVCGARARIELPTATDRRASV